MTFTKENWKEMQAKRKDKVPPPSQPRGANGRAVQAPPFPLYYAFPMPDWQKAPLDECEKLLGKLREEMEMGQSIVNQRKSRKPQTLWHCTICGAEVFDGQWRYRDDSRKNPQTGLLDPGIICRTPTTNCYEKYQVMRQEERRKDVLARQK